MGEYYPYHTASKTVPCEVALCRKGNLPCMTGPSRAATKPAAENTKLSLWITGQVSQTSLTSLPQPDGRTPAMYAPESVRFFRGLSGGAADRETVCALYGVRASWRQYRTSRKSARGNQRGAQVPAVTSLSLVDFPQSLKCFGRSKRRPALLISPSATSATPSGFSVANTNRRYRSSWPSSTKCCANRRSLTSVKEAA